MAMSIAAKKTSSKKPTKAKADPAKPTPAPKPEPVKAAPAKPTTSFAARCRALFAEGKTNAEIWAILQPEFNSPPSVVKSIPWHRANEARKANGGARRTTNYDATLAWFVLNQPKAAAVIGAEKPSFSIQLLAKACGRTVEVVQTDLRAALAKEG